MDLCTHLVGHHFTGGSSRVCSEHHPILHQHTHTHTHRDISLLCKYYLCTWRALQQQLQRTPLSALEQGTKMSVGPVSHPVTSSGWLWMSWAAPGQYIKLSQLTFIEFYVIVKACICGSQCRCKQRLYNTACLCLSTCNLCKGKNNESKIIKIINLIWKKSPLCSMMLQHDIYVWPGKQQQF